ncbi:DUF1772 domain-containing protein [Georgenia sp. Z1344]|uniref:anthrone oxygenase family protein n=1 Tax=Georgenia sp. Z1344 TaxID=3416706 RepID=UPI003CEF08E8
MSAASAALVTATVGNGLVAGLFLGFTCAVMPGLRRVDDAAFVATMRSVNRAILNPLFGVVLVGTPVATVAAVVLGWTRVDDAGGADGAGSALPWLVAGLAGTVLTLAITFAVNVPLNERLDRAPDDDDRLLAAARSAFERPWTRWNAWRTLTATAATALLAIGGLAARG